jgi:hypothetical protein
MHSKTPTPLKFYSFFHKEFISVFSIVTMPVVNNVEDARVEIAALQKERSLLVRLSALLRDEIYRIRNDPSVFQSSANHPKKITYT